MTEIFGKVAGVLTVLTVIALLLGWLVAAIWNHFPFMEALHHMTWWDGFLLQILGGLLFKGTSSSS